MRLAVILATIVITLLSACITKPVQTISPPQVTLPPETEPPSPTQTPFQTTLSPLTTPPVSTTMPPPTQPSAQIPDLTLAPTSTPQITPISTPAPKLTAKYLLAFHACDTATTNCNDPRNHKTYVAQSEDGASWQPIPGYTPHWGSVPDIIRRGDTIYVYNPQILRRYRVDKGLWEGIGPVKITRPDGSYELFVDPSPTVDENGKIVLFYLVGMTGGDPARCLPGESSCTKVFRSATEVEGSDGSAFTVDPGNRLEITITSQDTASDPDIFRGKDEYILYISRGPSVQALSSSQLRGNYTNIASLANGILVSGSGGIPAGHYDPTTGNYWTYVHIPKDNVQVIRRAEHTSLDSPIPDSKFTTIITGSGFPGLGTTYRVESPGFTENK